MARVTIEDCLNSENNRFKLVIKAANRARKLAIGADESQVAWNNDKPAVVALREIAAGYKINNEGKLIQEQSDSEKYSLIED